MCHCLTLCAFCCCVAPQYKKGEGLFGRASVQLSATRMPAYQWWQQHGAHVPLLQKVAVKALAQVASASACERNWSTHDLIHSKKRNRLQPERTEMMVYIHGNLRLVDKLQGMDYAEEQIQWAPEHKEALERLWGVRGPSSSS